MAVGICTVMNAISARVVAADDALLFRTSIESSYDSNVLRSATNALADRVYIGSVGMALNAEHGRQKGTLSYSAGYRVHDLLSSENGGQHALTAVLYSGIGRTGSILFKGQYDNDLVPRGGSGDVGNPNLPVATYRRSKFSTSGNIEIPDFPAYVGYSVDIDGTRYRDPTYAIRNQNSYFVKLDGIYAWMANLQYLAGIGVGTLQYVDPSVKTKGTVSATPKVGLRWQVSAKSSADVNLGTQVKHNPDRDYSDRMFFSMESSVKWKRRSYSDLSATLSYGNVDSIDPLVGNFMNTTASMRINHAFTNRWSASVDGKANYNAWKNRPGELIPEIIFGTRYSLNDSLAIIGGASALMRVTPDADRAYKGFATSIKLNLTM